MRLTTLGPREVGVRELLDLSDDRSLRRDAMHRLADDALRRNQITRALEYARDLDSLSNRDFSDRLLLLSILEAANEAETQSLLEQLKKDASDDALKIGALIGWMNSQKMSAAAVTWMKTLPPTLLVKRTTPLNLAAKDPINAEKTLRVLYDFYASRRDTQELYRVLVHLEKVRPTDRSVRNNLAQISLLLNLNPDQAYRAAREVYEQEPKNPDYAAPYAFSLYLQGDVKKALQALAGFSEAELERPQIAAYYGALLANIGDFSRATKFLDLGEKANLLPEEQKLVEKAQLAVARRQPGCPRRHVFRAVRSILMREKAFSPPTPEN